MTEHNFYAQSEARNRGRFGMSVVTSRVGALALWLEVDEDDLSEASYDECVLEHGSREYLVLEDGEADARTAEYIEESLWAFNAWFITDYLPDGVTQKVIEALQPQCEGANPAIRSMVGDRFDELVEDAIGADGRGHFLAGYDGEEIELAGGFFAYRTN